MRSDSMRNETLPVPAGIPGGTFPSQPLEHLDALWIQVAGTFCNLTCTHCFVPSGPGVTRHALMSRDEVGGRVSEALELGVREFYFTGGEPFVHPELLEILADTLAHGPVTVLTNGLLFTDARLERLASLADGSRYSLELRVSLDGPDARSHDVIRGAGTFERALDGLRRLEAAGLLPIVTVTRDLEDDPQTVCARYVDLLRRAGLSRPRLKILPLFQLGREVERTRPYAGHETLRDLPEAEFDAARLQCKSCRAVTANGVYVCPLLVDERDARLSDRLAGALEPFPLRHGACYTCYVTGMTCGNG